LEIVVLLHFMQFGQHPLHFLEATISSSHDRLHSIFKILQKYKTGHQSPNLGADILQSLSLNFQPLLYFLKK
jgi:hypothetical protein